MSSFEGLRTIPMGLKLKTVVNRRTAFDELDKIENLFTELKEDEVLNVAIFSDSKPNPALPQLKYLNGIVLKTISDGLPDHPPVTALYNYFEEKFAPILEHTIAGVSYEYFDLKKCKVSDMDKVIDKIIKFANTEWNIDVLSKIEVKSPESAQAYIGAYANQWEDLEELLQQN